MSSWQREWRIESSTHTLPLHSSTLAGSLSSLSLTAHSAGHTLGGTVWKLRSPTSGTLLLALDCNHVKERHIDGSGVIEGASRAGDESAAGTKRAEVLVTSGDNLNKINPRRKDKDKKLLDLIHHALKVSKSTVHLPLDASPRLLEVLLLLDQHWAFEYPHARFPLCLVSRTGTEVLQRGRTMREWMGKNLQAEGGPSKEAGKRGADSSADTGPLGFRFLRIFTSLNALEKAVPHDAAKVVITVGPSLLYGPSLQLFREQICNNPANTIVLTQRLEPESLASTLQQWWAAGQAQGWDERSVGQEVDGKSRGITGVLVREKVPLQGSELEQHLEEQRLKKEREAHQRAMLARSRQRLEADEAEDADDDDDDDGLSSEDEDDDDDVDGLDADLTMNVTKKRRRQGGGAQDQAELVGGEGDLTLLGSSISHDSFLKGSAARVTNFFGAAGTKDSSAGSTLDAELEREARERHGVGLKYRTFPVVEQRKKMDAYGEVIDVQKWLFRGRKEREEEEKAKAAERDRIEGAAAKRRRLAEGEEGENDPEDEFANIPTKFIESLVDLEVKCKIMYIDLQGLIDGRALSIVLPQLAPRRLVLVNTPQPIAPVPSGKAEAGVLPSTPTGQFISSLLSSKDFTREVFAPSLGQEIVIGAQVKSFDVRLGEGVLEATRLGTWEDWDLGWIAGKVAGAIGSSSTEDAVAPPSNRSLPSTVTLERQARAAIQAPISSDASAVAAIYRPSTQVGDPGESEADDAALSLLEVKPSLFVGDVRLSKLKTLLSSQHRIPSEFGGGGMLVCGSAALAAVQGSGSLNASGAGMPATANQASTAVTVQKMGDRIVVEGNAGRTFLRVRETVYSMFARVGEA